MDSWSNIELFHKIFSAKNTKKYKSQSDPCILKFLVFCKWRNWAIGFWPKLLEAATLAKTN